MSANAWTAAVVRYRHRGWVAGRVRPSGGGGYAVVRLVLALILFVAALLKGYQLATGPVAGDHLLSSRPFLIAVVEFEWLFGVWMVSGLYPTWTWRLALGCFGAFAGVSLSKGLAGDASCGCFGRVEVSPWYTMALDTAAVLALIVWPPRDRAHDNELELESTQPNGPLGLSRVAVSAAVALAVGIPGAITMATYRPATLRDDGMIVGSGSVVVLEPEKWVGKRFPLLNYINVGAHLAYGEWHVVLYRHDCPGCQELLSGLAKYGAAWDMEPTGQRVALIELPPYGRDSVDPFLSRFIHIGALGGGVAMGCGDADGSHSGERACG